MGSQERNEHEQQEQHDLHESRTEPEAEQAHTKKSVAKSALYMDTTVSLHVVTSRPEAYAEQKMAQAFQAFRIVEDICSRFYPESEVMQLIAQVGTPVRVSDLLFEAIRFAMELAKMTEGIFDPTVGRKMETFGFNKHYLTGTRVESAFDPQEPVSYRDVVLDEAERTVLLRKPLVIDLGAVAKGLAVDLAVQPLREFEGFVVDAGGDMFAGGLNEREEPWRIGVRHPLQTEQTICTLQVTDQAVCTSGSYERVSRVDEKTHHLLDPQTGQAKQELVSCTVIAPFAMMADAFSTAAFLLGPDKGIEFLELADLNGVLITPRLDMYKTIEMTRYLQ